MGYLEIGQSVSTAHDDGGWLSTEEVSVRVGNHAQAEDNQRDGQLGVG